MLETKIEEKACNLVWELLGIVGSKVKVLGENAFPDRLFWLPNGRPLLIEFKRPGEKPRALQTDNHKWLRDLGYKVEVHDDSYDALEAVINAVDTPQLPEESRKILARARRRCAVLRSRAG